MDAIKNIIKNIARELLLDILTHDEKDVREAGKWMVKSLGIGESK